jgi:hypothetical protein
MKKSRLLEIIREEISEALNVLVTNKKGETTTMPFNTPDEKKAVTNLKADSNITNIETTAGQNIKEDDLNEIPDFGGRFDKQVADKYGMDQTLEDATKDITDEILKDMGLSRDDLKKDADKAKEVLKAIRSKVVGKNQDPRVKKALEKQTEFDDSGNALQANQTNNAILKALGLKEPGQRGRKASEDKPKAEKAPKAKAEKSTKAKVATRTAGDDGFDNVSYSEEDDEVAAATKAISGDETAKELGNTPEEKKVKFNQFLSSVKKNKDDKAKIEGILKLAKDKFKFPKTMMDDLKRAAGREVEA